MRTLENSPPQRFAQPPSVPARRISTDEQAVRVAREMADAFSVHAASRDRDRHLPWDEIDQFSASGLWAITVPKKYGGAGVSFRTLAEVIATISAADPSLGQLPQNHFGLINNLLLTGSEDQKRRLLSKVLDGYRFGNAFSEANSKFVTKISTRIEFENGQAYLNGEKSYCTGALFAHIVSVAAVDATNRTFIAFIPRDSAGLSVMDDWDAFGQRTTASGKVVINNVVVPVADVLPVWRAYTRPTADGPVSQLLHAAVDTGIGRGAFLEALSVAHSARPWVDSGLDHAGSDPLSHSLIGDLAWRLRATEAMLINAADAVELALLQPTEDGVADASFAVSQAKILSTEIALAASERLLELGGARTVLRERGLDRFWRNARTHTLHDPVRWKFHLVGNYVLNTVRPPRHAWN